MLRSVHNNGRMIDVASARVTQTLAVIDPYFVVSLLLVVPVALAAGFTQGQLVDSADIHLHLNRIISTTNSLREGLFWPRWYPDMFVGYGYPLAHFYPPGASLMGAGFVLLGFQPVTALILTQVLALMAGASGAYVFARQFSDRPAALLAAATYFYVPFLFFQLYHIGNVPQMLAFNLVPWLFWAIARGAWSPGPGKIAFIAVAVAAIVLMHNLAGVMALVIGMAYALVAAWAASDGSLWQSRHRYGVTVGGILLGFALSAIYWLPAIVDSTAIQPLDQSTSQIGANLEDNFLLIHELFQPARVVDQTAQLRLFTLNVGWPQLALISLSVLLAPALARHQMRWRLTHIIVGATSVAFMLYLMTYHAMWLWEAVPGMDVIMHPWRFYGFLYAVMIPLVALALDWLLGRTSIWLMPVLLGILFAAILPVYFPAIPSANTLDGIQTPADTIAYPTFRGGSSQQCIIYKRSLKLLKAQFIIYIITISISIYPLMACDGCRAYLKNWGKGYRTEQLCFATII